MVETPHGLSFEDKGIVLGTFGKALYALSDPNLLRVVSVLRYHGPLSEKGLGTRLRYEHIATVLEKLQERTPFVRITQEGYDLTDYGKIAIDYLRQTKITLTKHPERLPLVSEYRDVLLKWLANLQEE